MRRNVSGQFVGAQLVSKTDGSDVTSGTTTVYVTGDAGTQAVGSVGSGACTHEGNGYWTYAPSQAETNYTQVAFTFVNTSAVSASLTVYPVAYDASGQSTGVTLATDQPVNVTKFGGTTVTARDIGASVLLSNGTGTGQIKIAAGYVSPNWGDVGNPTTTVNLSGTTIRSGNQITTGTAQAGTSNTITLAAGASATDGLYDPSLVRIISGTGAGQVRLVIDYNGTSKVCVIWRDWRVTPDATSVYELLSATNQQSINEGLAQGGAASSITLNAAASAVNDTYKGQIVWLVGGTGQDQVGLITAYNGTTKVATVSEPWATQPTSSSAYVVLPQGKAQAMLSGTQTFNMVGNITGSLSGSVGSVTGAVGSVTGNVGGNVVGSTGSVTAGVTVTTNNDKTGYTIATGGIPSGAHASAELNNMADALLDRNMATGTDSGSSTVRTPRQAMRSLRNKVSIAAGTATITKEDDATASWTAAVTTTAGNPISSIDPAGP